MAGRKILSYLSTLLVGALIGGGFIYRSAQEYIAEQAAWDRVHKLVISDPSVMKGMPADMVSNSGPMTIGANRCVESAHGVLQAAVKMNVVSYEKPGKPVLFGGDHVGSSQYVMFVGFNRADGQQMILPWTFGCLMNEDMKVLTAGLLLPDGKDNPTIRDVSMFDIRW